MILFSQYFPHETCSTKRGCFMWNLDEITRKVNGNAKLHHDIRVKYSEIALKTLGG